MSDGFLIDTSMWVKCLRGTDASLQSRVAALILEKRAFTSEIIIMEILRGAKSDKEYDMLYNDFLALPQLTIDHNVWGSAWELAYKLKKKGINVPLVDTVIAATALHHKCTLIHSDKHFNMLAKHGGLKVLEM